MDVEKARKLIENIRRTKFSIGGRKNPLMEDFHQAVKNHSAELYAKDVHYFMELVQKSRQEVIWRFSRRDTLMEWLQDHVKVAAMNIYEYAVHLNKCLNSCQKHAIAFVHFSSLIFHNRRSPVESVLFDEEWKTASHINIIPFIDQGYFGKEIHSFREELKSIGVVIGFNDRYLFIVDNLKSPSQALRGVKFFKMNLGYKPPGECFFFDPQWVCILQVFEGFAFIDHDFHGRSIFSYRNELKETGVKVDFEEILQNPSVVSRDCILFGPDWQSVFPIADLPFIDNSDNYYGKDIHEYKEELKNMRVVAEFEDGAKLVADGLLIPSDPTSITPVNVLPMLEWQARNYSFPNSFSKEISKKWLKTTDGYRPLDKGLLLDSSWGSYLLRTDGPFIDEDFYGSNITSYKVELKEIGVILDVKEGCSLIASQLDVHGSVETLAERMVKLLVGSSDSDGILLSNKHNVFMADDLQLKDIFEKFSSQPLFVWCPQPSMPSLPPTKLLEIYRNIGVRTISESVQKEESSSVDVAELNQVNPKEFLITKAISEGLLWENSDHIGALSELIKLAFILEFGEEAVMLLMKSKNLQIIEDEDFLSSAFPSD
nr:hypothetical protein CFP56_47700 [Quercus suber]